MNGSAEASWEFPERQDVEVVQNHPPLSAVSFAQELAHANPNETDAITKRYCENYPDSREYVTAIAEYLSFLATRSKVEKKELQHEKEKRAALRELTEFQFLVTHLVATTRERPALETFWQAIETLAAAHGDSKNAAQLRHSILTQVAIQKILNAKLSLPVEDAFHAIDMWTNDNVAVQVGGTPLYSTEIIETGTAGFPTVSVDRGGHTEFYSGFAFDKFQHFKIKLSEYGKLIHKDLKGFLVVIPHNSFDAVNGDPNEKITTEIRERLRAT